MVRKSHDIKYVKSTFQDLVFPNQSCLFICENRMHDMRRKIKAVRLSILYPADSGLG